MIKIALVGDVMLGRLVNQMLKVSDAAYPWGDTLSILHGADLRICNLECVLSDVGQPWSATPKIFHFRSDEKNVHTLQVAEINVVSLANNHVLDYDEQALLRMFEVLRAGKIRYAGAGKNAQEASRPVVYQVKGWRIGFFAFTDNEPQWEAKEQRPGVFFVPTEVEDHRARQLFTHLQQWRRKLDFLIVSAHWGPNWGYDPPQDHVVFARAIVESGADLVFGHSGHIFRGIEVYHGRPIIYCAGDFIDDYAVDEIERNDESFIFVLEIDRNKHRRIYLYPTYIQNCQANMAMDHSKSAILSKMQKLCKTLGTHLTCDSDHALLDYSA